LWFLALIVASSYAFTSKNKKELKITTAFKHLLKTVFSNLTKLASTIIKLTKSVYRQTAFIW